MKIRFFSQTRLILSFVPVGTGGKIAEVGGEKIFSYANLLFLNKSIYFLLPRKIRWNYLTYWGLFISVYIYNDPATSSRICVTVL
jgi:hypothetical protein